MPALDSASRLRSLLPSLKTQVHFQIIEAGIRKRALSQAEQPVYFPYADVLSVGLLYNKTETNRHLTYRDLDELALDTDTAIDAAVSNLEAFSKEKFRLVQSGFYTSPWKDNFDGARLLLTDLFKELEVEGDIVALTPAADALFVTGSRDADGLKLLTVLSAAVMRGANPLAALPLVLRNNLWQPFLPEPENEAFFEIYRYRLTVLQHHYEQQSRLLAETDQLALLKDRQGGTSANFIYTPPLFIEEDQRTGSCYSKTSVLEGSPASIPTAEVVEFYRKDRSGEKQCVARAPFHLLQEELGNKLKPDNYFKPERWFLSEFPDSQELSALGTMAAGKPPGRWFQAPANQLSELSRRFGIKIPDTAELADSLEVNPDSIVQVLRLPGTVSQLQERQYATGMSAIICPELAPDKQLLRLEKVDACSSRTVFFARSKHQGMAVLKLLKRENYDTMAIRNAFIKQSRELSALEERFGLSLPEKTSIFGSLQQNQNYLRQDFRLTAAWPDLLDFYQAQLMGDHLQVLVPGPKAASNLWDASLRNLQSRFSRQGQAERQDNQAEIFLINESRGLAVSVTLAETPDPAMLSTFEDVRANLSTQARRPQELSFSLTRKILPVQP